MSRTTGISWCQKTWNPITGCTKVSPGCKHCYAETMAKRIALMGGESSARYLPVIDTETGRWTGNVRTWPERLDAPGTPLHVRTPTTWFVGSMTDIFHEGVSFPFLAAIFAVMSACPQHRFMLLTKRPNRALLFYEWLERVAFVSPISHCRTRFRAATSGLRWPQIATRAHQSAWPLSNVAIGVSVENQECADERIPILLDIPAHRRFLSCEPLLAPVELRLHLTGASTAGPWSCPWTGKVVYRGSGIGGQQLTSKVDPRLHLVIIGCESGKGRRETKLEWIQDLGRSVLDAQVSDSRLVHDGPGFAKVATTRISGPALHIKQAAICPQCHGRPSVEGRGWSCFATSLDDHTSKLMCSSGATRKVRKDPDKPLEIYIPGYGTRTWREEMQW